MRWSHVISRRVLLTTVLVGITASACKETVTEPIAVASVTVTGGGGTLRLGQSTQLTTTLKSTEGWTLPNVGVSWTSSDAAKATISPSGQVTAVARGPVTLTAAAGGVTGTGAVTVIGVQSIALAPETLSVIVTQTRPMTATTVLDAGVTVTPTWRSLDTTIARVDTAGRVTAKS
ncbi:MAG: Ig-like domain-containing protein, partial [Myxococcota bacterium]